MIAETALAVWASACQQTGTPWFLFKDTLLCVQGYGCLPETLLCPQIAVFAEDLSQLVDRVFPRLPEDWQLDKAAFIDGKHQLVFLQEESPVLELQVLYGAEDPSQLDRFHQALETATQKAYGPLKWRELANKLFRKAGRLYTATLGKLITGSMQRITERSFGEFLSLAGTSCSNAALYSDGFTNKTPQQFDGSMFRQILPVSLGERTYPLCDGYSDYLSAVYGDYENGLHDDIGCGLTAEDKEKLRQHQARCFEALTFLQELSQEFGLRYYLLAGSVLGPVRHGGFIPWDDDIDVGIRIEELDQFETIVKEYLPQRLPSGFYLMQSGPNNPYPRMFSKICYEGRCCIDLWPLVPTYTDGLRATLLWYFAKFITKVHYYKIQHPINRFVKLVKIADPLLTDRMTMFLARYNERQYAKRNTPAYINLYSIYRREKETISRTWLDTEATALFNGLEVPVVGCTHEYLTHLYGDYLRFPPPWNRASRHFERFYPQ